jgi:hypothetical protein
VRSKLYTLRPTFLKSTPDLSALYALPDAPNFYEIQLCLKQVSSLLCSTDFN